MVNLSLNTLRRGSALQGLVAGLVAASVLAHALLGCCWHHDHGHGLQRDGRDWAVEVSCCGHNPSLAHHAEHDLCSESSREHEETPCQDGMCPDHHGPADCDSAACVATVQLQERSGGRLDASTSTVVGEVPSPGMEASAPHVLLDAGERATVRRHLWLQVWLA